MIYYSLMEQQFIDRLKSIENKLDELQHTVLKIRRTQRHAQYIKILYWVFLVLLGFGAFYFIEPYLSQLKEVYGFTFPSTNQSTNYTDLLRTLTQ